MKSSLSNKFPLFIGLGVAAIVTLYYVLSGRGSYEHNVRLLQENQNNIEKTVTNTTDSVNGEKSLTIKCKNGESYEIVYKEGQTNFDDLVYDKCGTAGGEEVN